MSAFDRISARIPKETKEHVSKTLDIVERIQAILEGKGMAQKDLAASLGKSPSEISKWMSGLHNFEVKTLVKIEEALGEQIFSVVESGKATTKKGRGQGVLVLNNKIAALPEGLAQQAIDFVDFLAQKEHAATPPKPSKRYKPSTAPMETVQEPTRKYQKGK